MVHEDILHTVDAINFLSRDQYCIDTILREVDKIRIIDPYRVFGPEDRNAEGESYLVKNNLNPALDKILATDIYNLLYNKTAADSYSAGAEHDHFKSQLSACNSGTGSWEDGWQIVESDFKNNQVAVRKGQVVFWVETDEVKCQGKADASRSCRVRIPKETRNLNASFFMIFGNLSSVGCKNPLEDVVRFYWNLTAEGALDYVRFCTEALNRERLHFKTKVISDPRAYQRSDAGVLYINRADLRETLPIIKDIHGKLQGKIKPATPLFAKRLADGLGFAEDPRDDNSFGFSRAKIIAGSLIRCLVEDRCSRGEIVQSVRQSFEKEGIDPMAPYALKDHLFDYEQELSSAMDDSVRRQEELT
ncbi:MAG: T3SS effector HopA1 family protein [Burkholderiales bacterium]